MIGVVVFIGDRDARRESDMLALHYVAVVSGPLPHEDLVGIQSVPAPPGFALGLV